MGMRIASAARCCVAMPEIGGLGIPIRPRVSVGWNIFGASTSRDAGGEPLTAAGRDKSSGCRFAMVGFSCEEEQASTVPSQTGVVRVVEQNRENEVVEKSKRASSG